MTSEVDFILLFPFCYNEDQLKVNKEINENNHLEC